MKPATCSPEPAAALIVARLFIRGVACLRSDALLPAWDAKHPTYEPDAVTLHIRIRLGGRPKGGPTATVQKHFHNLS